MNPFTSDPFKSDAISYIVPSQIKTLFCSATSMWHSRHSRVTKVGFRWPFRRLLFVFTAMLPPRALTTHLHASILTTHLHFSTMFAPPFNCLLLRPCHRLLPRVQVKCYVWPAEWEELPWKCWGIIGFRRMSSSPARCPKMTLLW